MRHPASLFIIVLIVLLSQGCKKTATTNDPIYKPTPYDLQKPEGFPDLFIDSDNPMTVEGVKLGRMLYYDSIIDKDHSRACAGCHSQEESFTLSSVNSLAHINLGWNGVYLWNGKIEGRLEDIMLFEVEEFFETDMSKLNNDTIYPELFKKAFNADVVTSKEVSYALAQFERTMISANSRWDRYLRGELTLTQAEAQGYELFFTEKGDCFHCHGTILFTDNLFHNNGLDSLPEPGRELISNNPDDKGKFKSPTLRNIMLTAPYMHDGRYETIEEVIDFYSHGVKWSPTIDPLMKKVGNGGVQLTQQEKNNLIAFLKTLTDTTYINNPELSDPFAK
ncbi:MAG: c-type cytochrome [Chlorobi bacterium]|nr:c-type cytochrome [Chlorobiota bacterium]